MRNSRTSCRPGSQPTDTIPAKPTPAASWRVGVQRIGGTGGIAEHDLVTVEEPLEVRLSYVDGDERIERSVVVTMRTPGADEELAIGFLAGEGIVKAAADVRCVEPCGPPSPDKGLYNVVRVELADDVRVDVGGLLRHFYATSSCGVCGKASLEAVRVQLEPQPAPPFAITAAALKALPARLKARQAEFARTGGLHSSAAFDAAGEILRVREDVGRHNALDKLAGSYLAEGGLRGKGVLLSGRTSFELLQKAAVAGVAFVAAIGPPSSLAVELAADQNISLVGFLNEERFNVYVGAERVLS